MQCEVTSRAPSICYKFRPHGGFIHRYMLPRQLLLPLQCSKVSANLGPFSFPLVLFKASLCFSSLFQVKVLSCFFVGDLEDISLI